MRTLVTGASGFIGANLVRRLLDDGHEVHLLLRETCRRWRLEAILPDCRVHWGDVSDRDASSRAVADAQPDCVFHLAAYGAYPDQAGFHQMVSANVLGCAALVDACIAARVPVFVNAGSSSEYGSKDTPAAESDRLEPNSHYAITKAAAAHYCALASRTSGLRAVTLRLYSIYGPWEEPSRLIPTLLVHCRNGTLPPLVLPGTARDFVYVDDAVDALIAAASAAGAGSVYNVASGTHTTVGSLVQQARSLFGVTAAPQWSTMPPRPWDTAVWCGDPSRITAALGWQARTSLRDGMLRTMQWLQDHPAMLDYYTRCILEEGYRASSQA